VKARLPLTIRGRRYFHEQPDALQHAIERAQQQYDAREQERSRDVDPHLERELAEALASTLS